MSIQTTRLGIITELLLKKNLQEGILPDSKEFIWQLNQMMNQAGRNSSAFKFKPFKRNQIGYAKDFNDYHDVIYNDLSVLYKNLYELHFSNNQEYQYFLIEKEKIEKQIDALENDLRFYIKNNQRAQTLPYAYDVFDDTRKVNLEKTENILVDTRNNAVKLVEEKKTTRRVYPQKNVTFKLAQEGLDKKERVITGELWNTLQNEQDKIWQKEIKLKQEQPLTGIIQYDFEEQWYLNQVDLSFLTVKPFELYCTYSLDNIEWFDLPNYAGSFEAQKDVSLNFPSIPMKHFRIEIIKSQSDEVLVDEKDYNYHYLFGLHEIRFYHKQYPVEGRLVSNPLEFHNEPDNYSIQTIRLDADEYIPTGTNIQYEIALVGEDEPNWQLIEPMHRKNPIGPQTISFMRMNNNGGEDIYFNPNYSSQQAEAEDLLTNGIPVYRLTQLRNNKEFFHILPRKLREGSLSLYIGDHSWEVRSFPSEYTIGIPKVEDFKGVFPETEIEYVPLTDDHNGYLMRNQKSSKARKYMARLAIYLTESKTITTRPVSTDPMAIYLNNQLVLEHDVTDESKDVHLVFKAGWNEIVVLINGQNSTTSNGTTVLLGFQPKRITDTIFSRSKPLQEVSLFDLQYNTKRHDRTVFAKREVEDGWEILTNFWSPGLHFRLYYDYKSDDLPDHDQLMLRATLTREDGLNVPTPILRSYRIECT